MAPFQPESRLGVGKGAFRGLSRGAQEAPMGPEPWERVGLPQAGPKISPEAAGSPDSIYPSD